MSSIPPASPDLSLGPTAVSPSRPIGSLWRRIFAFVIDGIIVGVAANLIALPLFSAFARLGPWGRLVGFCIALPYFAIPESRIGGGQTLGKRWLRLQVVDINGKPPSFQKAVLRYSLFAAPFFLNGLALPITRTPWLVETLLSVVIFGLGGATFYLVCFNRRTRQGVHDLAAGTYVTEAQGAGAVHPQPIWQLHWIILGSGLLVLFATAGTLEKKAMNWGPFPQMLRDVAAIEAMPGVQQAGVQDLTSWGGSSKQKIFLVNIIWTQKPSDERALADTVAGRILRDDPSVRNYDQLRINMIRGYDLGLAHAEVRQSFDDSPAHWAAHLSNIVTPANSRPIKD